MKKLQNSKYKLQTNHKLQITKNIPGYFFKTTGIFFQGRGEVSSPVNIEPSINTPQHTFIHPCIHTSIHPCMHPCIHAFMQYHSSQYHLPTSPIPIRTASKSNFIDPGDHGESPLQVLVGAGLRACPKMLHFERL